MDNLNLAFLGALKTINVFDQDKKVADVLLDLQDGLQICLSKICSQACVILIESLPVLVEMYVVLGVHLDP